MSEEEAEKEHEPTQKRLDDARRKGDLVRSVDLTTAAVYGGLFLAVAVFGGKAVVALGTLGMVLIGEADRLAPIFTSGEGGPIGGLLFRSAAAVAPFFIVPGVFALVTILAQRALVVAPSKLAPKLSRISPLANVKQKFGAHGIVEFLKSFLKLVLIALLLGQFLHVRLPLLLAVPDLSPARGAALLGELVLAFLVPIFGLTLVFGALDYLWQRFDFLRRNRMSRKEVMDEMKDQEGDPHIRQQRRAKAEAIATNRMLTDVPRADVVIVNPTHYAVALKWSRQDKGAPLCVAKGVDEMAARIRSVARDNGVPIHSDPPTARALHATVDVGARIRPEHYRAVAIAIRFAERVRTARTGSTR